LTKYGLILWDFDGTLADTLESSISIFNELAPRYGCKPIDDIESARRMSVAAFMKHQRISWWNRARLAREFFARKSHVDGVQLCRGLPEVLIALRQTGSRMGIVSSSERASIHACLRAHRVDDLFEFVEGYVRILGKHRAIRAALRTQRSDKRQCVYVGDECRDITAARKAGVDVAAVTWGYNAHEILAAARPTFLAHAPSELARFLTS